MFLPLILGTESEYLAPKLVNEAIETKVHSNMIPSYDALPFSQEVRTRTERKTEQKCQPVGLNQFLTKMVIWKKESLWCKPLKTGYCMHVCPKHCQFYFLFFKIDIICQKLVGSMNILHRRTSI